MASGMERLSAIAGNKSGRDRLSAIATGGVAGSTPPATPVLLPMRRNSGENAAGTWLPGSVRAGLETKTPAGGVAKPVTTLPMVTEGKTVTMPGYERESAAMSQGVSLPMARMRSAANTPEALKRQADRTDAELAEAQKRRAALLPEPYMQGAPAVYSPSVLPTKNPELEAIEKQIQELNAKKAKMGATYYEADNQTSLGKIGADKGLTERYGDAKSRQSDIDRLNQLMSFQPTTEAEGQKLMAEQQYFHDKFGAAYGDLDAYDNLLKELTEEFKPVRTELYNSGINFPRVNRYVEKKDEAAQRERDLAVTQKQAEEHPVLSSLASVIAAPAKMFDILGNAASYTGKSDIDKLESYEPMYATDFPVSNYVNMVRGTVSKKIEENVDWEIFGQNVASFAYNTGMSIADSAAQISTLGPYATYVMGLGAASEGARDVVARGGSNGQAFTAGIASGVAEAVFEKFSIDRLLTDHSVNSVKSWIKETAKQAGVEASEEMATEIANILSDAAIMGQNSGFNNAVRDYMAQGMTEEEAKQKAYLDNVAQVVWSGVGGALSGGIMGGAVNGMNYAGSWGSGQTVSAPTDVVGPQKTASTEEAGGYRAVQPQNVELPTVPIISLSTDGMKTADGSLPQSGNALRANAIARARGRLGLDKGEAAYIPASNVRRNGEEYVLKITKASLNKMLSPSDGKAVPLESIAVMDNIERIANNGVWFDSQPDRQNRPQINGIDHLMTTVYIDGAPYSVDMRVRLVQENKKTGTDNVLYYFSPEEILSIKKIDGSTTTEVGRQASNGEVQPPIFDPTIAPGASEVKTEDMQFGGKDVQGGVALMPGAAGQQKTASTGEADGKYVFVSNSEEQGQRLSDAYDKAVSEGKGVTIDDALLEKYTAINNNPAQKLINVIKDYYDHVLKGTSVEVSLNGGVVEVKFENDGKKKSVGWRMKPDKAATFEQLRQMFEQAEYAYSQENRNENEATSIPQFHYFVTNANIGGVDVPVKLQVRDVFTSGGDFETHYYTHQLQDTKKGGSDSPVADADGANIDSNAYASSSDPTIAPMDGEVKTEDAQLGGEHTLPQDGGSVGAAMGGFDLFTRLQNQYGTIEPGENPARVVDVPVQTTEKDRVSKTARTVMEAAATPDSFVPEMAQAVVDGDLSYIPITNKDTAAKAQSAIERDGFQRAYGDWRSTVAKGKSSADLTAMGATLYNAAVNAGDTKLALDILGDYAKNVRDAAQAVQAARILKTLTPEGKLYLAQKTVLGLQEELNGKYGDGKYNITINEELADAYLNATDDAGREAAMENIYKDVAAQVPASWADKWNAWRYFSMLGNPRTHIRNIAGNAGFVPVRVAKDMLATGMEWAADKMLPGGIERTKAVLNPANGSDMALLKSAWADGGTHMEEILGEGKFRDNPQGKIEEYRTIFKTLPLEAGRQFSSKALDVEDTWFSRPAYATALAGWLKANHTTLDTATASTLDTARAYAIREAQRATYRDSNAFSDFVSGLRYRGDNKVGQAANVLMEGVLPFRKTPANILVRGVEYSPIGLVKGLTVDLAQVRSGKMLAAQAIDNISAGLTGTGILALGALLASMGLVTGGSGDGEKDEQGKTMGKQPYALTIGDKNYTLDWLAPEALPFFVGVELFNAKDKEGTGRTLDDLYSAMGSITEPMLEMSMLQSLQDTIDSVSYSDNKLMGILSTAATGYLTQAFPTLLGQVERTAEEERQSTYIDRTSQLPNDLQYTLGRVMNKLPGEFQQMPYIDAWGRKQNTGTLPERAVNNFLNPSYVSEEKTTEADKEIARLLDAGQSGVAPNRLSQSVKIGDSYLTKEQYQSYAVKKGETSLDVVSELIGRGGYAELDDEQKAEAIRNVYSYAEAAGKMETGVDYEPTGWVKKAMEAVEQGIFPADYILYRQSLPDGSVSQCEAANALLGEDIGNREKGALWALQNDSWPADKNPFTGALSKSGVKPELAVKIAGKYSEIDKKYEGYVRQEGGPSRATAQTTEFYHWLDGLGLSDKQYDAATELYRFSTYLPGKPEGYRLDLMSEAAQKKWPAAEKAGFSEEEYTKYYPVFSSGTKHDAILKAVEMGMTRAEANRLWGIVR